MKIFSEAKNYKIYFSIAFFLLAFIVYSIQLKKNSIEKIQENLQKEILAKEKSSDIILKAIENYYTLNKNWENVQKILKPDLFKKEGMVFLIFKDEKLIFWSDNSVPLSKISSNCKNGIIKVENGWYRISNKSFHGFQIVEICLLKNEFAYQNEYLQNNFFKDYNIPSGIGIVTEKNDNQILNKNGDFLFSIQENSSLHISDQYIYIILILCIIGFILLSSFIYDKWQNSKVLNNFPILKYLIFILLIVLLRIITFIINFPEILYDSKLFSPYYYAASAYLPSLGDLFINSALLLLFAYTFFTKVNTENLLQDAKRLYKFIVSLLFLFTIIILFYYYVVLCKSIVIDSSIQMLLSDIFEITFESIIGSFIIFALSVSFVLFSLKLFKICRNLTVSYKNLIISLFFSAVLFTLFPFPVFWKEGLFYPFFFLCYIAIIFLFEIYKNYFAVFQRIVILILFFTFFSTFTFYKYNDAKEKDKRKLLIQKLSAENDPLAEYLFKDILFEIKSDTLIHKQIKMFYPEDTIVNYIKTKYFKGYFNKYSEQITLCKDFQSLIIKPNYYKVNCDKYFYDKITRNGYPTLTENLFSLDYGGGTNSYIAFLRFFDNINDSLLRTSVYIELQTKFISKDLGYPELLIDKKLNLIHDLNDYSYAKYVNKQLVKRYGNYFYKNRLVAENADAAYKLYDNEGYNHMLYRVNKRVDFIISRPKVSLLERLAPFSNIFIAFSVFLIFFGVSTSYFRMSLPLVYNFKSRLQLSILLIILISFIIIGATTLVYISKLNNDKNSELLTEKTHSVLVELEQKLGDLANLNDFNTQSISDLLVKLSNVFFTDINLYDINAKLIASSRMQIFDEGLISDRMNANAYYELKTLSKTQFVDKESIGKHEYLSSYMPFRNNENKLIAYINLPYFAKQGDLKREISSFLKAYLNIYLFLIIIAVIIALFISNYITRPLKLIMDNIKKVKLGKKNEKIEWKRNDEIGNLIIEYNSMIDQLAISADKLAKSEREVAWREMAKQVAHEIKNPLTPMKLSIQHLQKAWNDKVSDWDERLKRLTHTIIEQIDSLSAIATEFSDFAKMPRSDFEKLNISEALSNTIDLYKSSNETQIEFKQTIAENAMVYADKKQMIRVFNNLVKNSVQAVSEKDVKIIEVSLYIENEDYIIKIKDNGVGIEKNQYDKIFSPYFTTKSGGSGLGLAMVKSIIESSGGKIWFVSEIEKGTEFYIQLKAFVE